MSDGTTPPSAWDEDQPQRETGSTPKSKSPPPLPSTNPVVKPDVPTGDLIQFENDEEEAATVADPRAASAMDTDPPQEAPPLEKNPNMAAVLQAFLNEEDTLTSQDYMKKFYQVRVEQEKLRAEPEYRSQLAVCPQYYSRNRYRDILPYDRNRVEIYKDDENPDGYMNASYIQLPGGKTRFIAAQAPLPSTLDGWWNMIDEQRVTLIVILCKLVEMNKIKCERYWPEKIGVIEMFGDYEVTLEEEKHYDDDEYLLRILKMEHMHTGEIRRVHQLHYREWPDHGCPSGVKQLLNMIDVMEQIHEEHSMNSPILVHCSAGVGRTGTIIAINYIREQMKADTLTNIDVFGLVMALRRQRASMVQTQDQYQFVHRCIATYCRRHLGIPEPIVDDLSSQLATGTSGPVKLIAPPTPTTSTDQPIGGGGAAAASYHPDPTDSIVEDDSDAASVPDFPDEPPAPQGPEDLGDSAAN